MSLIADVFITTCGRPELLVRSLNSLVQCTPSDQYRLTIVDDTGPFSVARGVMFRDVPGLVVQHYIEHRENMGLGPSINQALAHISALNGWYGHGTHGDPAKVAPFIVYCQDDLLYSEGWLEVLAKRFSLLESHYKLAFASGLECVEHPVKKDIGNGMVLKDWIRAAQMFSRKETWMSMFPIPRLDPETGGVRAKPNDGMGSGVDWHFVRNHEKSVVKSGRTCLVIPGLVRHLGYDQSTWLKREMPESELDKRVIKKLQ